MDSFARNNPFSSRGLASLALVVLVHAVSFDGFLCPSCASALLRFLAQLVDRDIAEPRAPLVPFFPSGTTIELPALIQVRHPHGTDRQVEGARLSVDQTYSKALYLLPQHLGLWFSDETLVRPDKVMQPDKHSFPLRRAAGRDRTLVILGQESVLVNIGFDDGICLDVDEVFPSITLDA